MSSSSEDDVEILEEQDSINQRLPRRQYRMPRRACVDDYDDVDFRKYFRLKKEAFWRLHSMVGQELEGDRLRLRELTAEHKLLTVLRLLACVNFEQTAADYIGISQPTVANILPPVGDAILRHLHEIIRMPGTNEERLQKARTFAGLANFTRCIGAIDCTHVRIISPGGDMMALDGKAIIKEEITDKDAFEATATTNNRRSKGGNACKDKCRTPDSPESARAVAPRSPMSPQIHHSSLAPPPRPNRNSSSSPVVNGATTTPPPPLPSSAHVEQSRLLGKIRKFLGSLVQLAQDVHPEASDRVRALVLSFGSGGISIEDFRIALQEAINLPLRPHVIPLLKSHIVLLQREIAALSRATSQTPLQYVTSNENSVMEFSHSPSEYQDIFLQLDSTASSTVSNGNGLVFKRRSSDSIMDHHNGNQEWNDYMYPAAKRMHTLNPTPNGYIPGQPASSLFEYPVSVASSQGEVGFGGLLDKPSHREDREMRVTESQRASRMAGGGGGSGAGGGGEEEWKNIHTMLNCISAMVDKTKRAITILQQRGVDPIAEVSSTAVLDIRRQTEEKVSEFKRNAEEAVNQVKRQAVLEIQRAVAAAESRAAEVMSQERLRMEKFFAEISRNPNERDLDNKSPSVAAGQNACWNCGRKATETCSGCNLARYCGAFCQHKDWEHHHQICGSSRSDIAAAKHPSQVIALTANIRGSLARTPPTPSTSTISSQSTQPPSSQTSVSSLVPNGSTSSSGSK